MIDLLFYLFIGSLTYKVMETQFSYLQGKRMKIGKEKRFIITHGSVFHIAALTFPSHEK